MTITKQSINRMKTCLPVCNILFDPFHHRWLCIQVIHGDVKEALEKCHQHGHWSSCTWSAQKWQNTNHQNHRHHSHQPHNQHEQQHLDLAGVEIHSNDVVSPGHREHVGHLWQMSVLSSMCIFCFYKQLLLKTSENISTPFHNYYIPALHWLGLCSCPSCLAWGKNIRNIRQRY